MLCAVCCVWCANERSWHQLWRACDRAADTRPLIIVQCRAQHRQRDARRRHGGAWHAFTGMHSLACIHRQPLRVRGSGTSSLSVYPSARHTRRCGNSRARTAAARCQVRGHRGVCMLAWHTCWAYGCTSLLGGGGTYVRLMDVCHPGWGGEKGADLHPVHDGDVAGHAVCVVGEDRLPLVRVHEAVLVERLEAEGAHVAPELVVVAAAPPVPGPAEQPLNPPACTRRRSCTHGRVALTRPHRPAGVQLWAAAGRPRRFFFVVAEECGSMWRGSRWRGDVGRPAAGGRGGERQKTEDCVLLLCLSR